MTRLTRDVRRETSVVVQGRELMVELSRYSITLRQKGKRSGYSVPLEAVYHLGGKLMRRELDAEKKKGRKK
jgi:hypothetical protein